MPRGLELLIAQTILQGFDAQYGRFLEVTSGAQQRFEQADWHAVQQAMKNRIHLYDHHVGLVVEQLRCITNGQSTDAAFLLRVKEHYTSAACRFNCANILRNARLVVVVPAPLDPVTAMTGCLADIVTP